MNAKKLSSYFNAARGEEERFMWWKTSKFNVLVPAAFGAKENSTVCFLGTVICFPQHGVSADGVRLGHEGILWVGEHRFVVHDMKPNRIMDEDAVWFLRSMTRVCFSWVIEELLWECRLRGSEVLGYCSNTNLCTSKASAKQCSKGSFFHPQNTKFPVSRLGAGNGWGSTCSPLSRSMSWWSTFATLSGSASWGSVLEGEIY